MKVAAVLFDIDGTLVDSNEQHVDAWAFAFREAGHPQEREDIRGQIGKGGDLLVPALLPSADPKLSKSIADAQGRHFKQTYLDHVRPFPGAAELIAAVHASGRKVVLASSATISELDHYVALLGVGSRLAAMTSIDDVDTSKPAPDIFSTALETIGVAAPDALVVGDTTYDVEAARAAGLASVAVASGPFSARQLRDAGAAAVYADVADLLARWKQSPLAE